MSNLAINRDRDAHDGSWHSVDDTVLCTEYGVRKVLRSESAEPRRQRIGG